MIRDLADTFKKLASDETVTPTALSYNELLLNVWTVTVLSEGQTRFYYRKDTRADLIRLGLAFGYGNLNPTEDDSEATDWCRVTDRLPGCSARVLRKERLQSVEQSVCVPGERDGHSAAEARIERLSGNAVRGYCVRRVPARTISGPTGGRPTVR